MNEKNYQRPLIVQMQHTQNQKFGVNLNKHIEEKSEIDENKISDLVASFGSPLFIYSEKQIVKKYQEMHRLFSDNYPKVQFSWSYKTNYLQSICQIFHQQGSTAEVVSEFEYDKARKLNIPGHSIIYNGPDKPEESLIKAIEEQAKIHIDNFDEISQLKSICQKLNKKAIVGVRINLNSGTYPQWSRFGFNYESGQAYLAIKSILNTDELILEGIHSHIGTFILDPNCYATAAGKLCDLFNLLLSKHEHQLKYIDLGGGFPSKSHLRSLYQGPEISVPNVEEFCLAITKTIKNKIDHNVLPQLIMETGRYLIDEAGYLVTSVATSKVQPDAKRSYVLDAGVNLLYTSTWYRYEMFCSQKIEGMTEPAVLNGPLCMNIDIIDSNVSLPFIPSGSQLILHPVGAYNITQSMQFIKYRPAVVLIDQNNQPHIIKKRECLESIEHDEVLPTYLSSK